MALSKPHLVLKILLPALLVLISISMGVLSYAKSREKPLNLIIISVDTLRADHMSLYDYPKPTTPNIDKWAKSADTFTNITTAIPLTNPSFATLMTGKVPLTNDITVNRGVNIKSTTLAEILSSNGYKTAAFTTGALSPNFMNINKGFQDYNYMPYKTYKYVKGKEFYLQSNREDYEKFLVQSTAWLEENRNQKSFLWVHLMDPHAPYEPPEDLKCSTDPELCDYLKNKTDDELEGERSTLQKCQTESLPEEKVKMFESLYDDSIKYTDRLVGRLLDKIQNLGFDKNSIVIFTSDHGEGFDHNYYFNHRDVLYDSAVKIPLVVKYPGESGGSKNNLQIQNADFTPTILDLLKIDQGRGLDGYSFSQQIAPNPFNFFQKKRQHSIGINQSRTKFSITDSQYKYIYSSPKSCLYQNQTEEVYNLKDDPKETKNLYKIDNPKAQTLKKELMDYLAKYNLPARDDTPLNNQNLDELKQLPY